MDGRNGYMDGTGFEPTREPLSYRATQCLAFLSGIAVGVILGKVAAMLAPAGTGVLWFCLAASMVAAGYLGARGDR